MRPALLRLLKRPSALSTLKSLAASPIGLEQFESRYTRLRCHSRCAGQEIPINDTDGCFEQQNEASKLHPAGKRDSFTFPIYEIEPPAEAPTPKPSCCAKQSNREHTKQKMLEKLRLDSENLEYESDIGHTKDIGTRLVDQPEYRNSIELWEELLRFRQRHYGDQGTQDIWAGLTARLGDVPLPVVGRRAEYLWQSFVELGLKRELFLKDVVDYAIGLRDSSGAHWPQLYEMVVGGLLDRGMKKQAIEYHQKLQNSRLARPKDVARIIDPAIRASSLPEVHRGMITPGLHQQPASYRLKTLKNLCRTLIDHHIYGLIIPQMLAQGYGEEAICMHRFLVRRHDHPKTLQDVQPLLDYSEKYGFRHEFHKLQDYTKKRFEAAGLPGEQVSLNVDGASSKSHDKSFKDDIGGRLFATRALNFEMVLGGLKMLGVSTIGSQSLRELVVRAHSNQDILEKFKMLRQSGISVGDSVFARLVQKLAAQNRDILLSDLLRSDQHPDVLEDVRTQESLLVSYYIARDWRLYNMSLAILAELLPGTTELSDIHFRKHISAGEFAAASNVADEMALHGRPLSEDSMDFMAEKVLTPRRTGHRPPPKPRSTTRDEVMFIFKVLQRMVPIGGYVSAAFWVEMLKRLGMEPHYWEELRQCCHWLAQNYAPNIDSNIRPWETSALQGPRPDKDRRMLNLIFTPEMQAAIVYWGFRFRVTSETEDSCTICHPTTGERLIPWVRGILLLRELEQAGLALYPQVIREATRHRMAMLFGRYSPSARRMNRMLRRKNPYSRSRVLTDISRAWGESLFSDIENLHPDQVVNPSRSPGSLRRSAKVILSRKRAR
ncbi:hypothetical protein N7492_004403 [Penicillium capsulatum]|uniref:Pentatricopeptide repeat domain-containing protein n=1 Tax=Penicillium capsulatum TaxID=69766 RepID=A0A9W9I7S3_9EURO|nr:hypothetical protein N7492_004403 [Penicillium capsulatum]KAJ6136476.1 hypothetical protein N7512_001636 [Penicillium capsulatum]